jgi:hypothetical protein
VLEGFLVGIIDASLLRKAMQSCSGVDKRLCSKESSLSMCFEAGSMSASMKRVI